MLDWIRIAIDYNYWAQRKLLYCLSTVSGADFKKPVNYSIGSLHQQIVHVMWAEALWLARLQGETFTQFSHEDYPTLDDIREGWAGIEMQWRDYIADLTESDVMGEFEMRRTNGEAYVHRVRDVILHVVNHGTDHRAQMLELIHSYGGETFGQDMIFYLRQQQA
ncbi:MAG: DinB family protein [Aggregatilineales bacterium]